MNSTFIDLMKKRRSQYALGKNLPLPQQDVSALIQEVVRQTPSAFHSQSSRIVILFGAHSDKVWALIKDALRQIVPEADFAPTDAKINSFAAGAGTVLVYEDQNVVAGLQQQYPLYADNFPIWSEMSAGISQFAIWTALAEVGIGASVQHYSPLADAAIAAEWNIPDSWKLRAQMPFGSNEAGFNDKTFIPDAERFRVFS